MMLIKAIWGFQESIVKIIVLDLINAVVFSLYLISWFVNMDSSIQQKYIRSLKISWGRMLP